MGELVTFTTAQYPTTGGAAHGLSEMDEITTAGLLGSSFSPDIEVDDNIRVSDKATTSLYVLFGCLGTLGNALVIVVIYKYTDLKKKLTSTLIVHQSVIDLLSSVLLLCAALTSKQYDTLHGWWGQAVCKLWISAWALWALFTVSTYNLVALTLERYFAIVHPIRYKSSYSRTFTYSMMAAAWVIGPLTNLHTPLMTKAVDGHCYVLKFWPSITSSRAVGIINITIKYVIPLSLMAYCYTRMVMVLRSSKVAPSSTGGAVATVSHPSASEKKTSMAKKNVIKTLLVVSFCFVLCWSWNQIYFLVFCLGTPIDFKGAFYHFGLIMVNANCCLNPFIYAYKYEEFKRGLRKMLRLKPKVTQGTHTTSTTATA